MRMRSAAWSSLVHKNTVEIYKRPRKPDIIEREIFHFFFQTTLWEWEDKYANMWAMRSIFDVIAVKTDDVISFNLFR